MKASELIAELEVKIAAFGDFPVEFECDHRVPAPYMFRPVEKVNTSVGPKGKTIFLSTQSGYYIECNAAFERQNKLYASELYKNCRVAQGTRDQSERVNSNKLPAIFWWVIGAFVALSALILFEISTFLGHP